jgi:hypothetical protein
VSHTEEETYLFVWIRTNGQLRPQVLREDWQHLETNLFTVVSKTKITRSEAENGLDWLENKYPFKEEDSGRAN